MPYENKAAGAYLNHAALNAGQAAHAARYLLEHPDAEKVAPKGTLHNTAASVTSRLPEIASNMYYAGLPPSLHHSKKELNELAQGKTRDWLRAGYNPDVPMPTEKAAFKLQGHTVHQGLPIAIENNKGSVRKGVDRDGKPWRTVMQVPYGYIKGTRGADGEEVDCFVGPQKNAPHAFVVHQKKHDGSFDEHKIMLGTGNKAEAKKLYLAHYNTKKFLGSIKQVPIDRLKELLATKKKLVKISGVMQSFFDELAHIQTWSGS